MKTPNTQNAHIFLNSASWGQLPLDAFAYIFSQLWNHQQIDAKQWLVFPKEEDIYSFVDILDFFGCHKDTIAIYPANDADSFQGLSPTRELPQQRLHTLDKWFHKPKLIVLSSVLGYLHKSFSKETLSENTVSLEVNQEYDPRELSKTLQNIGYLYSSDIEEVGTFYHKGDILRLWPVGFDHPIRLSFFDHDLEAIHQFIGKERISFDSVSILPARELILTEESTKQLSRHLTDIVRRTGAGRELRRRILHDFSHHLWFPGAEEYLPALFTLVSNPSNIILIEPKQCETMLDYWSNKISSRWSLYKEEQRPLIDPSARFVSKETTAQIFTNAWSIKTNETSETNFDLEIPTSYQVTQQEIPNLLRKIQRLKNQFYTIVFVANSENRIQRFQKIFKHHTHSLIHISKIEEANPSQVSIIRGNISQGFIDPIAKLAFFSVEYILKMPKATKQRVPKALRDAVISNIAEVQPGDFVVHRDHGIGKFVAIVHRNIRGNEYACLQLEYANSVSYYLPIERIEQLYRYRTTGTREPKLDKIGSSTWGKRLTKAKEKAFALADQLIAQFAVRASQKGYSYSGYPNLLNDFSFSFPYQETPDQQSAIDDVLTDLANDLPMNRLVIGDVGFGKTEVALRAAVRVVAEGHQVALLCPTTILALQHHRNFVERCFPFGMKVALLTRLQTTAQKRKLLRLLQNGDIDILVGTKAIFNKSVRFKRLGLVIADEEHRFGVKQKEQLQNLAQLNPEFPTEYLAMSATPIPRTLHLALSGMRTVSVIQTPPPNRRTIQTKFMRFDIEQIGKQIRFELSRGGQVFFVHNRIDDLQAHANLIQTVVPEATIAVASGSSSRAHLEQTMLDLLEHRCHILVCTTIIENGIDLPNVNTIIINNAQKLGLAQLYQLRGRVGRGKEQGHCTLLIPESGLSSDALSRIDALKQYTALGSGFAIANADLEIRGSGDLLGKEQSGHIDAIGLDTYIDILNEAILELKPQDKGNFIPEINVPISTMIPADYIPEVEERLHSYRKMATARSFDDIQDILDQWETEYGPAPEIALQTVLIAEIRMWARNLGIERIDWLKSSVRLISHPSSPLSIDMLKRLCHRNEKMTVTPLKNNLWQLKVLFSYEQSKEPLAFLDWLYPHLAELLPQKEASK